MVKFMVDANPNLVVSVNGMSLRGGTIYDSDTLPGLGEDVVVRNKFKLLSELRKPVEVAEVAINLKGEAPKEVVEAVVAVRRGRPPKKK